MTHVLRAALAASSLMMAAAAVHAEPAAAAPSRKPPGPDPAGTKPAATEPAGPDSTGADPAAADPDGADPDGADPDGADPARAPADPADGRRSLFGETMTGGGGGIRFEIRAGWMIRPWIGAFASADAMLSGEAEAKLFGAGLRLAYGRMLVDVRTMRGTWHVLCDHSPSDVCMTSHRLYGALGVGLEVLRSRYFALELKLERMQGRTEGFTLLGGGVGLFL